MLLALGGLGLVAIGGLWALNRLNAPQSQPVGGAFEPVDGRTGTAQPSAFGLPDYPGSLKFISSEQDLPGQRAAIGSVAFRVKTGTSKQIADFYDRRLTGAGWKRKSRVNTSSRPGEDSGRRALTGKRVRSMDVR